MVMLNLSGGNGDHYDLVGEDDQLVLIVVLVSGEWCTIVRVGYLCAYLLMYIGKKTIVLQFFAPFIY